MNRRIQLGLVCLSAFYLAACLTLAFTKRPFCDEGWFGSPPLNLIQHGTFETSVIEPAGSFLKGIERHTYYEMPLYFVGLSFWYRVWGFSLWIMRAFSSFWGVVGILSCFAFAYKLTQNAGTGLLAAAILTFEALFIIGGATARMDVMAAGLAYLGLALYMLLRERDLTLAVILSNTSISIGSLTHPNCAVAFFVVVFLALYLDRSRIRFSHVALAALPYIVGLTCWGIYIKQDPTAFTAQFGGNAMPEVRGMIFRDPITAFKREILVRYLDGFGLTAPGIKRIRGIGLIAYVIGALGILSTPKLRRQPMVKAALISTLIMMGGLFAIDGIKRAFYLVYVLPMFAVLLAIWVNHLWQTRTLPRAVVAGAIGLLFVAQAAGVGWLIAQDPNQRDYLPVIDYLKSHKAPDGVVMGPSELGYGLGYDRHLVDDFRLGYYSGKRPQFIVVDGNYRGVFEMFKTDEPAVYAGLERELHNEYQPVYANADYVVYQRKL
jgi:4-amino-4-deoxy-L-arabinose transferase-like glycosyltransferase